MSFVGDACRRLAVQPKQVSATLIGRQASLQQGEADARLFLPSPVRLARPAPATSSREDSCAA